MSLQYWPLGFADSPSYAAPLTPLASFPPASTVEGQILRPAEVPRVELMASGGMWLPRGGRQVLQSRYNNPVTIQAIGTNLAERIGPFPGGLVRANMALLCRIMWDFPAIATVGSRRIRVTVGGIGHSFSDPLLIAQFASNVSSLTARGEIEAHLNIVSDSLASHVSSPASNVGGLAFGVNAYLMTANGLYGPTVDFSQPWDIAVWLESVNETAITITGATWSGGFATYTTSAVHNYAVADKTTVAGISPSGWNGVFVMDAIPSSTQFRVPMASDPGAYVSGGTSSRISNVILRSYMAALEG